MTSIVVVMVIGGSAAAAHAQVCAVSIVRAPDAVRGVVERWVAAEPTCGGPLAVRIVETDDGLYVVATDAEQHTFDRVVPDAESAGALIASWAVAATPAAGPRRVALAVPPEAEVLYGAPDAAEPVAARRAAHTTVLTLFTHQPLSRLGGEYSGAFNGLANLTGALDLAQRGRWSAGVALTVAGTGGSASTFETMVMPYGAWTTGASAWRFRTSIGLGLQRTWEWGDLGLDDTDEQAYTRVPIHLDATVSRRVAGRWSLAAGPLISATSMGASVDLELALQGAL